MKFTVQKSTLLDGLQTVQSVVSSRPVRPVDANVLIGADENGLTLTTTNGEIFIRCQVAAEVGKGGSVTLPVKRLFSIVRELPESAIEASIGDDCVAHIECGSSKFRLVGIPATEFAAVPVPGEGVCYTLERSLFADSLRKTVYAASSEDSRPILNSVLLNFLDGKLTTVATDGRRLAMVTREVEFPAENNRDIVLPTRVISYLLNIIDGEGDLRVYVKDTLAIFECGSSMLSCKLVDGVYPNFRQVVVASCENRIAIGRDDLLAVLRRMMIFTTEKNNSIRLTFEDNTLTVTAQTPDIGEAEDVLTIKYAGPTISVIFNPAFIEEPLKTLTDDEIYFELNDANSPGLIKDSSAFHYVIMPLRV